MFVMKMETATQVQSRVAFDFPVEVLKFSDTSEGEFHIVGYAATTDFEML